VKSATLKTGNKNVTVTIDLPEPVLAALEAQARAAHMPRETYLNEIVKQAVHGGASESSITPKKSAFGLLAKYGPGPTEEEIDANRREMFSSFGELAP
jgi:hypothetical protein